jgi:hypothetical protein
VVEKLVEGRDETPYVEPEELPTQLLDNLGDREEEQRILSELASLEMDTLAAALDSEEARKCFWINLYNAGSQVLARRHRLLHRTKLLFVLPMLEVAGRRISLNRIEYGILRDKSLLGFHKPGWMRGELEKRTSPSELDPRIHFALNCASASCPPVRYYEPARVEEQLEIAAESYLSQELEASEEAVRVPRMFKWFSDDFGGEEGVRRFVREHSDVEIGDRSVEYRKFNWSRSLSEP